MASRDSSQQETSSHALAEGHGAEAERLSFRIAEVCKLTGLGRTTIYAAIKSGALVARRCGRCTVVLAEDLTDFLTNLPKTDGR
jgi:excisionase family DNA binding protein